MYAMENEMETVHLYVVREQPKQPYTLVPLLFGLLCLLGIAGVTLYSAQHPYYEHQRLIVPAIPLPVKTFTAEAPIIPTGVKTYPATTAHGMLTFTNGSIIGQSIPKGFTVQNVATDAPVYVPPASADSFGLATVPAHLLTSGINLSTLIINQVIGDALYVRNLTPFTGGKPAYSVKYVTEQDKLAATLTAHRLLAAQVSGYHYPCQEDQLLRTSVKISWRCQFLTYKVPAFMHVTNAILLGRNFLLDVAFLPRLVPVRMR